jgi:hypothetical protein
VAHRSGDNPTAEDWIGTCHMTILTRAYKTIARTDIIAGLPEKPSRPYVLYTATGKTFRIPDGRQNKKRKTVSPKTLPVSKEVPTSSSWTWTSCGFATWQI